MGQIQGCDLKTEAELVGLGADKTFLTHDDKIYVTAKGINETLDDAITLGKIGGGGIAYNYLTDGDFESGIGSWYIYNDGASATPVDGFGGTLTSNYLTITRTTTAGQVLRGGGSGKLSKTANNAQGWGLARAFTIDLADKCKPLTIRASCLPLNSNFSFTNADLTAWVYDVDNSQLIPVTPYQFDGSGAFVGEFQTSTSLNYRIIFHVATVNATQWDMYLDDLTLSVSRLVYSNLQDRQYNIASYVTASNSGSAGVCLAVPYKTKDGSWRMRFNIEITGTASSSRNSQTFTISGITSKTGINQAFYAYELNRDINSCDTCKIGSATNVFTMQFSTTTVSGSWYAAGDIALDSQPTWATDYYPVQVGDGAETRVVASKTKSQSNVTVSTTQPFQFSTAVYDTHSAVTNASTWKFTAPVSGYYRLTGALYMPAAAASRTISIYKNGSFDTYLFTVNGTSLFYNATGELFLNVGDFIDIRPDGSYTSGSDGNAYVAVSRMSGPATISAAEKISVRYKSAAGQNIADNTLTIIDFGTGDYDTHALVTTGANWKCTFTKAGKYSLKAIANYQSANWGANTVHKMFIYKNGSEYSVRQDSKISSVSAVYTCSIEDEINVVPGDYIDFRIQHNQGTSLPLVANANYVRCSIHSI